jgi:hypothetical protein
LSGGEALKIFEHETSISSYEWGPNGERLGLFWATEKAVKESALPYSPVIYEENLTLRKAFIVVPGNEIAVFPWKGTAMQRIGIPMERNWHFVAPTALVDDSYMMQIIQIVDADALKHSCSGSTCRETGVFYVEPRW